MNTNELYEQAGKPERAVVELSEPTKIWTGLRRSKIAKSFEAYITETKTGKVVYYINPNSYHCFYLPENVTKFTPVDTMELWKRARKAADHIKAGRIHGRELDNAFENNDGDEMCAALFRMTQRSEKLSTAISKAVRYSTLKENADKFSHLNDKELSEHAKQSRMKGLN